MSSALFLHNYSKLIAGDQFDVCIIAPLPGAEIYNSAQWDEENQAWAYKRVIGDIEYLLFQKNIDFSVSGAGAYKTFGGKEFQKHNTQTLRQNTKTGEVLGGISSEDLPILRAKIDAILRDHLNLPSIEEVPLVVQQLETSMGMGNTIWLPSQKL